MVVYQTFIQQWYRLPNELKCHVFGFLSLSDVISFAHTSLQFRVFALDCLRLRLNELVTEYRLSLYTLFMILDRFNTVISGSTALEIVHPTGITPNNLDLLCPKQEADSLCSFLMFKGYTPLVPQATIGPSIIDDTPGQNCIDSVRFLRQPSSGAIIHVLVATSASPLVTLFSFHSTFTMNFISAHAIYSCYYSLTEQNKGKSLFKVPHNSADEQHTQDFEMYRIIRSQYNLVVFSMKQNIKRAVSPTFLHAPLFRIPTRATP
ncbi:hypothetical protein DFP72DRAFT_1084090 [Ephemerocybe angulata]|uniref:F-box domain-containing protein n=1 Tax=Ephemerocybe angulata TaxID=980116 RepID=A0A8H6H6M3_9AGAR|nr:hypothetical protein DFP72DRAFT_1084090 [Tulosesus angulatus]